MYFFYEIFFAIFNINLVPLLPIKDHHEKHIHLKYKILIC
ncbi:hypothetical protein NTHI1209_00218 [Haemophilus influenzae]|uniref:Uncharacterized protein n=1 Tax=Haemophilus influenzae TaxID=727 RepID=A0A158SUS2_HAEIF|nr:hypothetical protein NTHI1209_00218 [Haemophilus influenzae]